MKTISRAAMTAFVLLLTISAIITGSRVVEAAGEPPAGPDRYAAIEQEFNNHIWWLARWEDSYVACQIEIEHGGLPTVVEVFEACGEDLYEKWESTAPCTEASTDPASCQGYYLHYVTTEILTRTVPTLLPPAMAWVSLDGCIPFLSTHRCDATPTLVLTGEEPLAGHAILRMEGSVDGVPFTCDPVCQVDMGPTDDDGRSIRFWAVSSYGDTSQVFEAQVRVKSGDDPADPYLYVDVLSEQWRGANQAACMQIWQIFPPVGGLQGWLASPDSPLELASNVPYEYLAGNLISSGAVSVEDCDDGGLLNNGYASACGMEAARQMVDEWQDQFDRVIFEAGQSIGVPAQLLKNIFGKESQFWPGVARGRPEAGLGQMTDNGADTTFLWNIPFYEQFCPSVLGQDACASNVYPDMEKEWDSLEMTAGERTHLQQALVARVNASCVNCPLGIDLVRAEESVTIFAEMLLANCSQAGMVVEVNADEENPPTYENMWRFTLVNYNAGPGCLGLAIHEVSERGESLDWEHVSLHLTTACRGAMDYITDISGDTP